MLALAGGLGLSAVGVDQGQTAILLGLAPPDLSAGTLHRGHQVAHQRCVETTKKVSCRRGSRNPAGAKGVKKGFVIAMALQVIEALAAGQDIEDLGQNVI